MLQAANTDWIVRYDGRRKGPYPTITQVRDVGDAMAPDTIGAVEQDKA